MEVSSEIDATLCEKDLGVHVDPLLNFDEHINQVCKKGMSISGLIRRNMTCRSWNIMVPLSKALVRPHIEYANAVWSPYKYKVKHIKVIEQIQRNFTRLIHGLKNLDYTQILKRLKLPICSTEDLVEIS